MKKPRPEKEKPELSFSDKQSQVVTVLQKLARIAKLLKHNPFKSRALAKAAEIIDALENNFETLYNLGELQKLPGIGPGSLNIIDAVMKGKTITDLARDFPVELLDIAELSSVGLTRAKLMKDILGIITIQDLENALQNDKLVKIPGIGKKVQERIAKALSLKQIGFGKLRLNQALLYAETVIRRLLRYNKSLDISIVGDLSRGVDLIDSIELLIIGNISKLKLEQNLTDLGVSKIIVSSKIFFSYYGVDYRGIVIKLHRASKINKGIAQIILTGSNKFIDNLLKTTGQSLEALKRLKANTETKAFELLNLAFVPPEIRESHLRLLKNKSRYPKLIELSDLCGAFHNHTVASDGKNTLIEMRQAAIKFGLKYISINDHSQSAFYAGGQSTEKLLIQVDLINQINKDPEANKCFILNGVESDIKIDGSLDYEDSVLETLQIIVASVHNKLAMPYEAMTPRMIKAASHPCTTIIGHPTGRLLLIREPSVYDLERLLETCRINNVAIELNCQPARLDLCDRHLQMAKAHGVLVAINADAHSTSGFDFLKYGIILAKRAGLTARDVLNTLSLEELKLWLRTRKNSKADLT